MARHGALRRRVLIREAPNSERPGVIESRADGDAVAGSGAEDRLELQRRWKAEARLPQSDAARGSGAVRIRRAARRLSYDAGVAARLARLFADQVAK